MSTTIGQGFKPPTLQNVGQAGRPNPFVQQQPGSTQSPQSAQLPKSQSVQGVQRPGQVTPASFTNAMRPQIQGAGQGQYNLLNPNRSQVGNQPALAQGFGQMNTIGKDYGSW